MPRFLVLVVAWLAASPAFAATAGRPLDLVEALETGDWNERIRAVHALGARGRESLPALRSALADPDWQVRLTAGHWLARLANHDALADALDAEECPAVRMSLAHWLGGMGVGDARLPPAGFAEDSRRCESWFWPDRRGKDSWLRPPKRTGATQPAEGGCLYIHYHRPGRRICPRGMRLRGVGPSPHTVEFLEGRPPASGVALCCPAAGGPRAAVPAPPRPVEAECRLMPLQCPPPWVEMEPRQGILPARKDREFRRTRRHKEGDITWVHCCKAPPETPPAAPPPARTLVGQPPAGTLSVRRPESPSPEPPSQESPEEEPPERAIALAALAKSERSLRLSEIESLLSGDPETLPRPVGPGAREEKDYVPAAPPPDAAGRTAPAEGVEPLFEGRAENLPRPEGIPPGEEDDYAAAGRRAPTERPFAPESLEPAPEPLGAAEPPLAPPRGAAPARSELAADPRIAPDRGRPTAHDPLPELLKLLKSRGAAKRARAAEQIGALGAAGAPAAPLLKTALKDPSPRVRSSAALALGNVTRGRDDAVRELRRALKDKHIAVRYSAAQALGRVGTPAARRAFGGHLQGMTRRLLGQ